MNKVDLKPNSTKKFETATRKANRKQSIHETDEIKCSNRYETLMLMNLAIHTIVVPLQTAVLHLKKFLSKSHRVIYKRKKIENFNKKEGNENNIKEKDKTSKEKTGNLDIHKNKINFY